MGFLKEVIKKIVVAIITWESRLILNKYKPFVISVTGNLGKTGTKDAILAAISSLQARGTSKSLNSEFGIPLTIIGAKSAFNNLFGWVAIIVKGLKVYFSGKYPKYLVLEIGADRKGDIESVSKWLKSDIVVMTQFSDVPVHIENFSSREELIREKEYLLDTLKKTGLFIYNKECRDSVTIADKIDQKKISFGKTHGDVKASIIINDITQKKVTARVMGINREPVSLERGGVIGDSPILCSLPALIIAKELGVDIKQALGNLKDMQSAPGRMKVLDGRLGSIIIDDSYNASPLATEHGIKVVGQLKGVRRKIMVIGDMLELGDYAKSEHYRIGTLVAMYANVLVTVGTRASSVADGAMDSGMGEGWVLKCENSTEAAKEIAKIIDSGDLVYIKGSQGVRMERVTKMLIAEHVDASEHLPRQEEEWLKR